MASGSSWRLTATIFVEGGYWRKCVGLYESVRMEMGSQEVSSGGAMGTAVGGAAAAAAAASARGCRAGGDALLRVVYRLESTLILLLRLAGPQRRAALIRLRRGVA